MDPIQTISTTDEGKTYDVPESRIGNAADARSIIAVLVRAEQTRSFRRSKVNGLLNGNRPWSAAMLQSKGQGERTNLNLRTGEGFVAAAKTPYYDLENEVDRYAQFTLEYGGEPSREEEWADKVATRYHYALDNWDGRELVVQRSGYQMVVHGAGPRVWTNSREWRSESRMAGQILVPDDASADVEEWETAAIPRSYLPSDLWQEIKNESSATAAKWNVPAAKKAIMEAAPDTMQKTFGNTWEYYENEIRKGSAGYDNKSKRIFVTDLFQKEFTGKISHLIVVQSESATADNAVTTSTSGIVEVKPGTEDVGFLYRKIGRYDCFSQIVQPFLYDVGPDGQWHSVKGAGPKIFDYCEVENRLTCRMIDGAMAASGLIVQAEDGTALQETAITHISSGVALHPKYKIHQNRLGADLQSPLLVKRDLAQTLSSNTGQYRPNYEGDKHAPTLGQEQLALSQQAILNKGDVNRYYRSLDRWHRETFRRLLAMGKRLYASRKDLAPDESKTETSLTPSEQAALDFYRGCIKGGVPEEAMEFENFRVKTTRSVGYGSQQMRLMIAKELVPMLPTMDPRGRNVALRMWASAVGGQNVADMLYPRYDMPQLNDDHMALATLENNALRQPDGQVMVTPRQDHAIHFQIAMQDVGAHAQQMQQGQSDPMSLMVHMEQAGPHTHEHLFMMMGDPTRKAQIMEMQKAWLGLSKMADQLKQQLEEAAAAQAANQPAQGPDPELIAEIAKINAHAQTADRKMLLDSHRKDRKQAADLHRKDLQAAHGMRLDTVKAAPDLAAA